jgi:hypothetical protein
MSTARKFSKILTARESSKNKCFGPEGHHLVPALREDSAPFRVKTDDHFFVSVPRRLGNHFGWVTLLPEPITADELRAMDLESRGPRPESAEHVAPPLEWYLAYLEAVEKQPVGTPMASHWVQVNLPGAQSRKLRIHKVFFYEPKK